MKIYFTKLLKEISKLLVKLLFVNFCGFQAQSDDESDMDEVALNMEPRDGFMDEFFAEVCKKKHLKKGIYVTKTFTILILLITGGRSTWHGGKGTK